MTIITTKTVTIGMKAKKALIKTGIKADIIKIDSSIGCQYGIKINDSELFAAINILRENEIEYGVQNVK
jgi:hypothetical protein